MSDVMILRAAYVLDESGGFSAPLDVLVEDSIVTRVGPDIRHPDARDVDLAGRWLMPGIFDCHAHLACFADDALRYLQMPVTRWTLELAANARRLLDLGVTFVRDPGGTDVGIRGGIADGLVPGPTVQVSTAALCQSGGHGDGFLAGLGERTGNGFLFHRFASQPPTIADGVDGVRTAVRLILGTGVDWLKICTTGGLLSPGRDHPDVPEFTRDEVETAVFEARRKGVPTMAHAYGGEGLTNAVEAGVRSIEHGSRLTEEQAASMASRGCWLVPTLAIMYQLIDGANAGDFPDSVVARVRSIEPIVGQAVAIAREHGVRVAVGTDLIWQGHNLRELVYLGRTGMPAAEVLLAATTGSAELCGVSDHVGRIAEGYRFDAIVLDRDPTDLTTFETPGSVIAVFQRGRAVRDDHGVTA